MRDVLFAVLLGAASGIAGIAAYRLRWVWLGWFTLAPLAVAVYLYSPLAAGLAGGVCGALAVGGDRLTCLPAVIRGARLIEALMAGGHALVWGLAFAAAAWLWPDGVPAWGAAIMPAAAVAVALEYRLGSPRWSSWFLGSQDRWLPAVHIARLGSDLVIPGLVALSATVPVMLVSGRVVTVLGPGQRPPSAVTVAASIASILVVAGALGFGLASYRRAAGRVREGPAVRVAAVAAAPAEFHPSSPAYRDVDGLIGRYEPLVARAIAAGAQLIVLPEDAAVVTAQSRAQWLGAVSRWARQAIAPVVAGLSEDLRTDELVIADEAGQIAVTYDKQHPAPFAEPKPKQRTPPALLRRGRFPVSAVVCVDLDYPDLARPVARAGGVLAVPANDWEQIVEMHHRSAVWAAVTAGVPVVRSAGHGISAVYDAAGRVIARADSLDGPVVLVADVPITAPAATPGREPALLHASRRPSPSRSTAPR